jgi:membrane associated rhomboid family serine protease
MALMAECSECGKQSMSFTCRYCGEKFCSEHRLPEKHNCTGLDSGKKEEYQTSTEKQDNQKWFEEKFSDTKSETQRQKEFQRPGFFNETKRILKSNIGLLIIGITGLAFMLHQAFPALKSFLTLSPALTQAAVEATNTAAQQAQPGIGAILYKTVIETPWTLLTVMLVHANLFHLLANMITFYFFGTAVEKAVGGVKMLKMYLVSGIVASIAYIVFRNLIFQLYGPINNSLISLSPAVGASGAVVAMVGLVAMLYPEAEVLLYFVIPMKIRSAVYLFAGLEIFNLLAKIVGVNLPVIGGFASSAHLAGLAVGLYYGKKLQDRYGRRSSVFNPVGY